MDRSPRQRVLGFFRSRSNSKSPLCGSRSRRPAFETLEGRWMLARDTDFVFLVDKSASINEEYGWIADFVSRSGGLDDYLTDPARGINPRYGLVGFGDQSLQQGHSHLLDPNDSNSDGDRLFGTAAQLSAVAANVARSGSHEYAWDGIEHAIAEYEFRDGAAVIFVMFRRDDYESPLFDTEGGNIGDIQTFAGTLAALNSYNVTLNAIVEAPFDAAVGHFVLGVEADEADGRADGNHIAYVNVGPDALVVSHQGSNSGTYIDSGKSVLISQTATPQIAGPSFGGYRAQATTYAFEDISSTGTDIDDWDDDFIPYKTLTSTDFGSFSFPFYGETQTSLIVNTDGTITFDAPSANWPDEQTWVTNEPDQSRIAPYWAALHAHAAPYDVYWQVKDSGQSTERLIVQWDGFSHYLGTVDPSNTVTFQAALYKNGNIVFSYEDVDVMETELTEGEAATIGIATDQYLSPYGLGTSTFIDGVHDVEGDLIHGAEDDFVRLAWATGGAAWNNDVISGDSGNNPDYAAAFDIVFMESIGRQILDKHARGDVVFPDVPILEINMGGAAMGSYIADTNTGILGGGFLPSGTTTDFTTETIVKNGNSMAGDADTLNVFKTARVMVNNDLDLSIPANLIPDGRYVVELMFSSFSDDDNNMSIFFEGATEPVLSQYVIENDFGKIPTTSSGSPEYEALTDVLGDFTPIVKRYAVDVTGGNGLQIKLKSESSRNPAINGLRILQTPPPRIEDIVLKGSGWTDEELDYAFSELVSEGTQLKPIPTQHVDVIEVHFDGPVDLETDGSNLKLVYTKRAANGDTSDHALDADDWTFDDSDADRFIYRWLLDEPLEDGKYVIYLNGITGGGLALDGDWHNVDKDLAPGAGPDTFDAPRAFIPGDGTPGSITGGFFFALLAGDYDRNGWVNAADILLNGDGDGDGDVDGDDDDIPAAQISAGTIYLPFLKTDGADFNDNDVIDVDDLAVWAFAAHGGNANGDATGDGLSNGNDFLEWQQRLSDKSVWAPSAVALHALTTGVGPKVTNVIVSGSQSSHAPFSFDTVDGSGEQLKTVPVGGADTITIVFDRAVNILPGSLFLVGLQTINVPTLAAFAYDPLTHAATWRFEGWSIGDQYLLALSDEVTSSVDEAPLDGEWTNPNRLYQTGSSGSYFANTAISEFPSGDDAPGGWFTFVLSLLPGDADLNGIVNSSDYNILAVNYGIGFDKLFVQADFDGNGIVNGDDYDWLAIHFSRNLQVLWIAADLNLDGTVNGDDLAIICDNAGMTGADWEDGDLDGDGEVTDEDRGLAFALHNIWTMPGFNFNVVS